jgi:hypothetical protein
MPITAPQAPAAKTPRANAARPAPSQTAKLEGRAEAVDGILQLGAAVCVLTRNHADAQAIDDHRTDISIECAKVAADNEQFGNLLDRLSNVGPYAGLLTAVMPLALQLAVNHKRMEAGVMGTVSPEVLEAKVKADIAEKKTAALQSAHEAQQRAATAQANLESAERGAA